VRNSESTALTPCKGLGIVDFMRKKHFLITGSTGFLAKGNMTTSFINSSLVIYLVDPYKLVHPMITGCFLIYAVLIEKILRMHPDIGKLFLIIRVHDSTSALKRLMNEVS